MTGLLSVRLPVIFFFFFFFNDTATTEIYTLSLHDALPISWCSWCLGGSTSFLIRIYRRSEEHTSELQSHSFISYAVFCLKKKNKIGYICADINDYYLDASPDLMDKG